MTFSKNIAADMKMYSVVLGDRASAATVDIGPVTTYSPTNWMAGGWNSSAQSRHSARAEFTGSPQRLYEYCPHPESVVTNIPDWWRYLSRVCVMSCAVLTPRNAVAFRAR
jgi:hypothetical protein